ncbi:MAG: hypothetical protein WA211_19835 [Candidatus Acidiferrales bacterium]
MATKKHAIKRAKLPVARKGLTKGKKMNEVKPLAVEIFLTLDGIPRD